MGSFSIWHWVILLIIIIGIYLLFFRERKLQYSENKILKTFETIDELLLPHKGDHQFIKTKKEAILPEIKEIKKMYSRSPSTYTKEEIAAFENIIPELKKEFRDVCDMLRNLKPTIINFIDSQKKLILSAEEATAKTEEFRNDLDDPDDTENIIDFFENVLETAPVKIKEKEEELNIVEKNIERYGSL